MNNYFVSYDLHQPLKNYPAVQSSIESLGRTVKIHFSLYFVSTNLSADQVVTHVSGAADADDKILVIVATGARWNQLPPEAERQLRALWT